jgi:hypothetical protein
MNQNADYLFFFLILVLALYIYNLHQEKNYRDYEYDKKLKMFKSLTDEYKSKLSNKVKQVPKSNIVNMNDLIDKRDKAVLANALYPPLNRNPKPIANDYLKYKRNGLFDYSTRDNSDTYRLMGYLINSANKDETWNIFGRQKYSGSSHGEFYATRQCNQNTCTKIPITRDILTGNKIDDYYNLPNVLTFDSPLFTTDNYDVVQLKTSHGYSPYY